MKKEKTTPQVKEISVLEIEKILEDINIEATENRRWKTPKNGCIDDVSSTFYYYLTPRFRIKVEAWSCDTFFSDYKGNEGFENILKKRGYKIKK